MFRLLGLCFVLGALYGCGKGIDANGTSDSANPATTPTTPVATFKKIGVTAATFTGNFGASSAAAFIQADANCSAEFTGYKALMALGSDRHPDTGGGALNWVLLANKEYRQIDGVTVIGTTNSSAVFTFPLTNSFTNANVTSWTGLQSDWSTSGFHCASWTSSNGGASGKVGAVNQTGVWAIEDSDSNCSLSQHLICVEQ